MHTKIVKLKEYNNDQIGLFVQTILTELLIIFAIIKKMKRMMKLKKKIMMMVINHI